MSCDCINRIEKMLNEKMAERYPNGEVVDEVFFTNKLHTFGGGVILGNPVLGKVRIGKSVRKFDTQVSPTYCPFCGKKIKEGGDE